MPLNFNEIQPTSVRSSLLVNTLFFPHPYTPNKVVGINISSSLIRNLSLSPGTMAALAYLHTLTIDLFITVYGEKAKQMVWFQTKLIITHIDDYQMPWRVSSLTLRYLIVVTFYFFDSILHHDVILTTSIISSLNVLLFFFLKITDFL